MRRTLTATVLALGTAAAAAPASAPAAAGPAGQGLARSAATSAVANTTESLAESTGGNATSGGKGGGARGATGGRADGRTGGRTGGRAGSTARAKVGIGVVGLTSDQRLVAFDIRFPGRVRDLGRISALRGDTGIVGIDHRVRDGGLYGVGDQGGVYTLARSGKATMVSRLTVALSGSAFGVDVDPAADVLRVIGDTGQNLRHDLKDLDATGDRTAPTAAGTSPSPATGTSPSPSPDTDTDTGTGASPDTGRTVADRPLTTAPVPPATTPAIVTGVSGIGYTNNDLSAATAAVLFGVDTVTDRLGLQSPADAGLLTPTGSLRVDVTGPAGLDVHSSLRGGVTVSNSAFATLKVAGRYHLYGLNLLTGAVNYDYGAFPAGRQVVDLAVRLDRG